MYGYYYDSTYILVIFAFLMTLIASGGVKATFAKYDKVINARRMTGAQAARMILDRNGLRHIRVEHIAGDLSDHYDPRAEVIRLSDSTYNSASIAAVGVAAHEVGHAVQHAEGYVPIKVRNSILPVVNIGSAVSMPLFFIGLIMGSYDLAMLGVLLFSGVLVFQLVTLPVEFNASRRALVTLEESNLLYDDEVKKAAKVLRAAAMTYVAAVAATALQLLRLVLLANRSRRD
ncbi:MAG: zinc metallopeptidase [Clostridia bacterium]|nr:zinc metallopeptidase [Clostridia bacterium]